MKTSRLISGLAAVAMAAASVSATAGTRASDAANLAVQPVKLSAVSGDVSRSALTDQDTAEVGGPTLIILIIAGIVTVITIIVATNNNNDLSPGS
jgi:hypothetical protein